MDYMSNSSRSQKAEDYFSGAAPAPAPMAPRPQYTVTGQASGLINLAAKPVKWVFHTAGGLVKWMGSTIEGIGNKL